MIYAQNFLHTWSKCLLVSAYGLRLSTLRPNWSLKLSHSLTVCKHFYIAFTCLWVQSFKCSKSDLSSLLVTAHMWWFMRSWIDISHLVSCECYGSWFKLLTVASYISISFQASSHGLCFMIIWLLFIWWWSKWFKHAVIFMLFHYMWMLI